ncbi:MAG TPA: ACT domain-containing protein [Candidatus Sulfotelmatobacter sp.]|nr:ACT domain-containing protein [Candidatus Sulfotelmatobacter sp.]
MQVPLVMTVIGKDRPGLVQSVARVVAEHHGNWLESRMCQLGGEFAGILRVHVPAEDQEALIQGLRALQAEGLNVVVQPDRGEPAVRRYKCATLEIVGQDRPGIVRQISQALAQYKINFEEFSSEWSSAPMTGESLFKAQAHLQIPETCNLAEARKELEKIASDLMVDMSLQEISQR